MAVVIQKLTQYSPNHKTFPSFDKNERTCEFDRRTLVHCDIQLERLHFEKLTLPSTPVRVATCNLYVRYLGRPVPPVRMLVCVSI